nr:MAG TPA: hypothetical protein [Caudoviricetes sp.]DAL12097.1 MAG TPA_asm: hypothetical protein [Bacteriophage sp.]
MERLTFEGSFCDIAQCRELPCPYNGACSQRKVWERLKAYEDTGLEPEEVNDAVVGSKLLAKSQLVSAFGIAAERLRELAEADKNGRVAVLPVKPVLTPIISSMLYIIEDGDIYEDALYEAVVGMSESGKTNVVYTTLSDQIIFEQADIGKTVFLTREAAGKALEAMVDG